MQVTPKFTKTVIGQVVNDVEPVPVNLFLAAGDISGNGVPDVVLSGRNGRMVWLENRGRSAEWAQHVIDEPVDKLERGGLLYDLTGDGRLDIVNGGDWRSDEIYWWENPGAPDVPWTKRLIARTGRCQFHDAVIGDVTGDGVISLVFSNQIGGTDIYRVPLPRDPRVSPWPRIERIAAGKTEVNPHFRGGSQPEEGLAIGDVDGDGRPELVCGTHWYKYERGVWQAHKFATGYITTRVAVGDLDGDGRNEIVLAEGDPCIYGKAEGGKLAWFKAGEDATALWSEHLLAEGLLDPHTLQLGDVLGGGRLDILAGEAGVTREVRNSYSGFGRLMTRLLKPGDSYVDRPPRILLFQNDGTGRFTRHVIDEGTGIHDGLLVDVLNRGTLDIVGKPLHDLEKWNVHVWYNDTRAVPGNGDLYET